MSPRRTDGAAGALHPVDEIAVEVADFGGELPLAEEILDRIGRKIAGQVQDADIDGGHRDSSLLAGAQARDSDRQLQGSPRAYLRRRRKLHLQRAGAAIDGEPCNPERTPRLAARGLIEGRCASATT